MKAIDPELKDYSYGPETYDAIVITALAAQAACSDDPTKVAEKINDVTRPEGDKCSTYEECKKLIDEGKEIDYEGVGGPYTFSDAGEPTEASFAILQYGPDSQIDDTLTEYRFAKIEN